MYIENEELGWIFSDTMIIRIAQDHFLKEDIGCGA